METKAYNRGILTQLSLSCLDSFQHEWHPFMNSWLNHSRTGKKNASGILEQYQEHWLVTIDEKSLRTLAHALCNKGALVFSIPVGSYIMSI